MGIYQISHIHKSMNLRKKLLLLLKHRASQGGGAPTLFSKISGLSPYAYYPLNEASGTTAIDYSGNHYDGTYSGGTLGSPGVGDGNTSLLLGDQNDYIDVSPIIPSFNGDQGTFYTYCQVGDWGDVQLRYLMRIAVDSTHFINIFKSTAAVNVLTFQRRVGTNTKTLQFSNDSLTNFIQVAMTWDTTANAMVAYVNGSQVGSATTLSAWTGTPVAAQTIIGKQSQSSSNSWFGSVAHVALFNRALTPTEIATLVV